MSKNHKNGYYNQRIGAMTVDMVLSEIGKFVHEDSNSFYRLVIGSDSQIKFSNGLRETDFVTAIVIHRVGFGARYFWSKEKIKRAPSLKEKIYTETTRSLNAAQELFPKLERLLAKNKYDLEIHIDVGQNGPTRDMIKEVVGMVSGNGFKAKTKPESWAASSVADKHT
ncbi:ribonuclease H-like YkuK family protein [Candidatus Woesebacteria bacterium]|nr:ribonuclease H-like YkuK family protein [Candidatus Woesebacteria bacterium]QQG47011.1 MAG: ribonuclease H-like YkuK family protein [Candidatus Woesebacteria bacterium]